MRLLITFVILSISFSKNLLAITNSWPEYQCMLQKFDPKTEYLEGICSGTYLNSNVFVTAGHCVEILSAGNVTDQTYQYVIDCPSLNDLKYVKSIAVHPHFFINYEYQENFDSKVLNNNLVNSYINYDKVDYNDIALLYTESVNFKTYPILNTDRNFVSSNCSFLGFSSEYCSYEDGSGCYRTNIEIHKPNYDKDKYENNCNLESGDGCYLNRNEKTYFPIYLGAKALKHSFGDSGSGMICEDQNRKVLVGLVNRLGAVKPILSISHKSQFINEFLSLDEQEFIEKSKNFLIDSTYRLVLEKSSEIKRKLHSITFISVGHGGYSIITDFDKWISQDESRINSIFEALKISNINVYNSPSLNFLDKPFISDIGDNKRILNIGTKANIKEIQQLLIEQNK